MIIKADNKEINVKSVIADKIQSNGKTYPALKFVFNGPITEEVISALTSGKINIEKHVYAGYNTVGDISVTIGKITTAEQERDELAAVLETTTQEKTELQEALSILLEGGN